jgi:hypothetical protein
MPGPDSARDDFMTVGAPASNPHDSVQRLQSTSTRLKVLAWTFVLLVVLTAIMTWPQVRQMTSVPDEGDPLLNTWALSWVAHQLPIAPARLFHANIFYPERYTLLYSESLIAPALTVAPLSWLGVPPVVVYNVAFLLALVFSGVGVALLVLELTGTAAAAVVSGIVFAFMPFRMDHYSHMQLQQTQWIPMALWALHRVMDSGRTKHAVLLGAFAALQLLSCVYFGLFLFPYLATVALVLFFARARVAAQGPDVAFIVNRRFAASRLVAACVAAAVFLALAGPLGLAYVRASQVVGERSPDEAIAGSATPANYLGAPRNSTLYKNWLGSFGEEEKHLFPGFVVVALAIAGLRRRPPAAQVAYVLALLVAFDLSLGFNGLTFEPLFRLVGPFRGLRVPARMGLFVGLSLSVLAGYGVARLGSRIQSAGLRRAIVATACALILLESRSDTLTLQAIPSSPPEIYADLVKDIGDSPPAAIVEFPQASSMPTYMYYSTFHWQNLLNGYSGFFPPSYIDLVYRLESFPDVDSLDALRRRGTRYVVVHQQLMPPDRWERIVTGAERTPDLSLVTTRTWRDKEIRLYRVVYPR